MAWEMYVGGGVRDHKERKGGNRSIENGDIGIRSVASSRSGSLAFHSAGPSYQRHTPHTHNFWFGFDIKGVMP